jgi:ubiquinone biosynthesis protein UbiJ
MATQSPFSFLNGLVERAVQAVQPPSWLVHETQQRIVLFLNHVLMQEREAMERLVRQKGRVARVQWRNFSMALVVTPAGLLNLAAADAQPDLQLEIMDSNPLALAQAALRGGKPALRIEGDVQLAADINWLVDNVEWDVEEDMARILGDVPAHTLANIGRTIAGAVRQFVGSRSGQANGKASDAERLQQ